MFLIILFLMSSIIVSAHIGMRPARVDLDYKPGEENTINYYIDTTPDVLMNITAEGDMSEGVTFSKTEMQGSGSFLAKITMPNEAIKPGPNDLYIFVKQIKDAEKGFGTAISLGALVRINVPYPGKYAQGQLSVENINKGEPINVELTINNRGKEAINVKPKLGIYFKNESIEDFELSESQRIINVTQSETFKKTINSKDYLPGDYRAISTIDYGGDKPLIIEQPFRIGSLNIEITNYTRSINEGKINPFFVEIQSDWKDEISGVYANVSLFDNQNHNILNFLTPPVTVSGFQSYMLKGFVDATQIKKGTYNSTIIIHYQDKTTTKTGIIEVISDNKTLTIIISSIILALLVIGIIIFIIKKKNKNNQETKSEQKITKSKK